MALLVALLTGEVVLLVAFLVGYVTLFAVVLAVLLVFGI